MSKATLIALVDGSIYSESVCHHAAWIAGRMDARVKIYHVLGRREGAAGNDYSGAIRLGARTRLMDELSAMDEQRAKLSRAQGRAILEDAQAIVSADGITEVETRLRSGDIVETITSKEDQADMILIGKRGEAADFAKLHLGSNLERIVRASRKPVFVANREFKPIQRVLIAYDGGVSAMKAVDYVARDPLFAGLDVTVAMAGEANADVRRTLDQAEATLKAGGHAAEIKQLKGAPEKGLGELVEEGGTDLLVMGAYGHSRIRSMVIGSTTSEMIRTCKVPVVLIR